MPDPLVSVLMPVLDEERFIRDSLAAVLGQNYPNLEVLVIDGGSTDRTVEIAGEIQSSDERVRILHNPGRWQVKALNIGLKAARGEIIVRVDGHTFLAPDYVRRACDYLLKEGADRVDNVGGLQRAIGDLPDPGAIGEGLDRRAIGEGPDRRAIGEGLDRRAIAAAHRSWFAAPSTYRIATRNQDVDTVFLGAWRREVFDRVGPWNDQVYISEDCEHNYRIRKAGGRVLLAVDLRSSYACRGTLSALWRQYCKYGKWKMFVIRLHPGSLRPRQLAPPAFVVGMGAGSLLGFAFPPAWWLVAPLAALYLLLAMAEAIRVGWPNWATIWRIPLVFATMHVAYGVGFLGAVVNNALKGSPEPQRVAPLTRASS